MLNITKMKIKPTMRYHIMISRRAIIKSKTEEGNC